MTLTEYFSAIQPISDEVVNDVYYKDISVIEFACTPNIFARIEVARVDIDRWAFGWTISDGGGNRVIERPCTARVITKGEVNRLVYGMTKVLQKQVKNLKRPSFRITNLIDEAVREAKDYTTANTNSDKITI